MKIGRSFNFPIGGRPGPWDESSAPGRVIIRINIIIITIIIIIVNSKYKDKSIDTVECSSVECCRPCSDWAAYSYVCTNAGF